MNNIVDLLQHIDVVYPIDKGKYLGNYKCHCNSLSYALRHPKSVDCIIGCLQVFSDGTGVAHFVVKCYDGTIIDPSYGNLSTTSYEYLLPIEEYKVSTFSPNRELLNLKAYLYNQLPWYTKLFTRKSNM